MKLLHAELGTTWIYVTHDQEEAMSMSDRVVVIREGRIAQQGTPEEIYARPASAFVADFIGHSNLFPATVAELSPSRVRVSGLPFLANGHPDVKPGQEVRVLVRPEALSVLGREERAGRRMLSRDGSRMPPSRAPLSTMSSPWARSSSELSSRPAKGCATSSAAIW